MEFLRFLPTSFRGETSGDVTKSRLFTQDIEVTDT